MKTHFEIITIHLDEVTGGVLSVQDLENACSAAEQQPLPGLNPRQSCHDAIVGLAKRDQASDIVRVLDGAQRSLTGTQ